jgi:hypothetical protein
LLGRSDEAIHWLSDFFANNGDCAAAQLKLEVSQQPRRNTADKTLTQTASQKNVNMKKTGSVEIA